MKARHAWKPVAVAVVVASLALCGTAHAAVDMFLKIGDIKGESIDSKHKGEIDVLAWSWGVQGGAQAAAGAGRATTRGACVQAVSITKWIDLATPDLLQSVATGRILPQATLTVRKAGQHPLEFLVLTFTNVTVSSESTGGSGGEDRLTENITLDFQSVQGQYTQQDPASGGQGAQPKFAFSSAGCANR